MTDALEQLRRGCSHEKAEQIQQIMQGIVQWIVSNQRDPGTRRQGTLLLETLKGEMLEQTGIRTVKARKMILALL
jgi:hypothetical protein